MANAWFRFKQFVVEQDRCAMKVGTDGVLLGAWSSVKGVQRAVDVGTGTGLLALMLAQRNNYLQVDALEIDAEAVLQAGSNIAASPFADRIRIHHLSFQKFCDQNTQGSFDLVICNPPFFSNSLHPEKPSRSMARHDDHLTMKELFRGAVFLLQSTGYLSIILPADQLPLALHHAKEASLFLQRMMQITPLPEKPPKRVCLELGFVQKEPFEESLIVEEYGRHGYSDKYRELTGAFYPGF